MWDVAYTTLGSLVAVTAGVRSTLPIRGVGSEPDAVSPQEGYRVVWDPSQRVLRTTPGPLVYLVRQWDGDQPTAWVKIGWTGVARPDAATAREKQWSTGTMYPTRFEGLVPDAPESLERALHRALGEHRTSNKREWFEAPRDDPAWRQIVEATCRMHRPKKGEGGK